MLIIDGGQLLRGVRGVPISLPLSACCCCCCRRRWRVFLHVSWTFLEIADRWAARHGMAWICIQVFAQESAHSPNLPMPCSSRNTPPPPPCVRLAPPAAGWGRPWCCASCSPGLLHMSRAAATPRQACHPDAVANTSRPACLPACLCVCPLLLACPQLPLPPPAPAAVPGLEGVDVGGGAGTLWILLHIHPSPALLVRPVGSQQQ